MLKGKKFDAFTLSKLWNVCSKLWNLCSKLWNIDYTKAKIQFIKE